jgi:nucleoside-diphosphate-sugar epimerase
MNFCEARGWQGRLLGDQETVVVLGGNGFVGTAIVQALVSAGFRTVSAQRRPTPSLAGVEQRACDATQPVILASVLHGADHVVNAIGGSHKTMLSATKVLSTMVGAGTFRTVIHISSMAVYGTANGPIYETDGLLGAGAYAKAKIACETYFAGTRAIIFRPGIVYGPGGEQWVGRIGRLLRAKSLGDLGKHGDGYCNLIHARDIGAAVVAALRQPHAVGHAINLGPIVAPRWNEVLVAFGRAIGAVPVPRIAAWRSFFDSRILAPPLYAQTIFAKRLGRKGNAPPDAITPALLRLFAQRSWLDSTRADRLLCLQRQDWQLGLRECALWFGETYGLPIK